MLFVWLATPFVWGGGFDYKFGPSECNGEWKECGNATFDVYVQSRNLSIV